MLKIDFSDSTRKIEMGVKAIFLNVCKDICLKLGVVFKQSGDFSKADTGRKYGISISKNHARIKIIALWLY